MVASQALRDSEPNTAHNPEVVGSNPTPAILTQAKPMTYVASLVLLLDPAQATNSTDESSILTLKRGSRPPGSEPGGRIAMDGLLPGRESRRVVAVVLRAPDGTALVDGSAIHQREPGVALNPL